MTKIYLSKTPQDKREANPKLPYFRLVLPPEQDGGEWVEIGALWQSKNGKGYSGKLRDNVKLEVTPEERKTFENTESSADQIPF